MADVRYDVEADDRPVPRDAERAERSLDGG